MIRNAVEDELRDMIKRLLELPEMNMEDLEFHSEMVIKYARALIEKTS